MISKKQDNLNSLLSSFISPAASLTICPIFIATCMAFGDGIEHWPSVIFCGLFALSLHCGTYLIYTHNKQKITPDNNSSNEKNINFYNYIPFVLSFLFSLYFLSRAGWIIWALSMVALLFAIFINFKIHPLQEPGSKEMMIFLGYGPLALSTTYFIQSLEINIVIILTSCICGFMALAYYLIDSIFHMSVLHKSAQEHLLIIKIGKKKTFYLLLFSFFAATLMPIIIHRITHEHSITLLASLSIFAAIPLITNCMRKPDENFKFINSWILIIIYWIFSIIFSIGWLF